MTATMPVTMTPAVFTPPGKGGWKRLADHYAGVLTPEYRSIFVESCPPAMRVYMARYGVLAETLDVGFVHGHLYITPVPLFGPREMRRTPPAAAVWLMSRLHPEFRRRTRAAARTLATRPWRAVAAEWFATERATWIARNEALQAIDPSILDAPTLADHLGACRANAVAGYYRHFELHGDDLLPLGLLLVRCKEWGVEPALTMQALTGSSAVSTGAVAPPAWHLVTGYDLDSLAWCELGAAARASDTVPPAPLDLRTLVASEHHDELAALVDDARAAVPLRDDNGALTGAWPMGLLRRAMLEIGRRSGLHEPAHAVELRVDELVALLGGTGPTAEEVAARAAQRRADSALDAPVSLGPDFNIPPLSALPRALALIGGAQLASADHMIVEDAPVDSDMPAAKGSEVPRGVGIGTTPYTGRALVVDDPGAAMSLVEPGDVVITKVTSPSWNVVLAYAGAVVTATGGLLSHAAVIARELDIAAVIGDTTALSRFVTGDVITVDPVRSTVTLADLGGTRGSSG